MKMKPFVLMLTLAASLREPTRRQMSSLSLAGLVNPASAAAPVSSSRDPRPLVYRIEVGDPALMQPFQGRAVDQVLANLAKNDVVLIGVTRNDADDLALAVELADRLGTAARGKKKRLVVGVDAAPYGEVVAQERAATWPAVENPLVLEPLWQRNDQDVLAMGVQGDTLRKVQKAGVGSLNDQERSAYVDDPLAFASFPQTPGFDLFARRCISRRYEDRYSPDQVSAGGYFASSLLQDQAVAAIAARHLREHPADLLVAILDSDRVQFKLGSQARLQQAGFQTASILVNPSASSTYSASSRLRLELTADLSLPGARDTTLADYVWFSASPPPRLLVHMLNPIDGSFKLDFGLSTGGSV